MRVEFLLPAIALSFSAAACSGGGNTSPSTTGGSTSTQSQTILSVQRWTGTLNIRSKLSGGGATNQAGMSITEAYEQDTTAQLTVTLTKDPNGLREWRGPATGNVQIRNLNNLTMIAPANLLTCTGTLFWIGTQPLFSGQATLETDAAGTTYKISLTPTRIDAPDSGSVVCPTSGLTFPTIDPRSPFAPDLLRFPFPAQGVATSQSLVGTTLITGDSGIGGFIASAVRIPYLFDWNLTGTP